MNKRAQTVGTAPPTAAPAKKKLLLIGGIALIIVLIIVLFFVGRQFGFVGKAIAFTPTEGFVAGAEAPLELPLTAGETITIRVGAVVPAEQESAAWEFTLNYDTTKFKLIGVSKLLSDWGDDLSKTSTSVNEYGSGLVKVEQGTLDYTKALTGGTAYRLAEVNFEALEDITTEGELGSIYFTDVSIWGLVDTPVDLIPVTATLSQPAGLAKCVASAGLCGNFCTSNANDGYCGAFCSGNQDTYCTAKVGSGYTTDINGDGEINDQDAFVVLKIKEAKNKGTCGAGEQEPCAFGKTYTCDDGSFRVDGYKGYVFNAADQCPYSDTGEYIGGS